MNILELIAANGCDLKKAATTHGGEYCGACPFCGGSDRFRVWPEHKGGRFWCRACNKHGDAIQFLRDSKGYSYQEACERLGIDIKNFKASQGPKHRERAAFKPKEAALPPQLWREKATAFFQVAQQALQADRGREARIFLHDRGLLDISINGLGWNANDTYRDREAWGLLPERRSDGRKKRIWLPAGLVIPLWEDKEVIRLRVRRSEPGTGPRYVIVSGSSMIPMVSGLDLKVFSIVESELDGFLIRQEAGNLSGVIALGSVSARPDRISHEALLRAELILLCLDFDEAGARESRFFWAKTYGSKVKRWPVPVGKDPSQAYQEGLDIAAWIKAGIQADKER